MNIQNLDLNLLKTLNVLLEEKSVSRAAVRLSLSQSAVSHALGRLRKHFDDPLLLKVKDGMVPTAAAEELIVPLNRIINEIKELTERTSFDPATAKATLKIAASDYGAGIILPRLLEKMSFAAPFCNIDCSPISTHLENDLKLGLIDLAFGGYKPFENFSHEKLFDDRYVGVVRSGHPVLNNQITSHQIKSWPHVYISASSYSQVKDNLYRELNITNSEIIFAKQPYFLVAPIIVERSDHILIMPEMGAKVMAQIIDIELFELPIKRISFPFIQVWDRRRDSDQMHQWFRQQIKDICTTTEHFFSTE